MLKESQLSKPQLPCLLLCVAAGLPAYCMVSSPLGMGLLSPLADTHASHLGNTLADMPGSALYQFLNLSLASQADEQD